MNASTAVPTAVNRTNRIPGMLLSRDEFNKLFKDAFNLLAARRPEESLQVLEELAIDENLPPWFYTRLHSLFAEAKPNAPDKLRHIAITLSMLNILDGSQPSGTRACKVLQRFVTTTRRRMKQLRKIQDDREADAHSGATECGCCQRLQIDASEGPAAANVAGNSGGAITSRVLRGDGTASSRGCVEEERAAGEATVEESITDKVVAAKVVVEEAPAEESAGSA